MTQTYELASPPPTPLVVNTEDWLKALTAVSQHQASLSRMSIAECVQAFGHRRCCCVCGDTQARLNVCNHAESPIAYLLCGECFLIQLQEYHTPFYQTRELTQYEEDVLRMVEGAEK